ncbi:MAG: glycosyltransferase [Patescibacteria group bacterium]
MNEHILKICYAENARLPTEKAHGYQIMKTCEALAKQGLDVTLVHADRKNPLAGKDPFEHYGVEKTFKISKLPVWDILTDAPSFLWSFAFVIGRWSFTRSLKRWMKSRIECDVLYTRDPVVAQAFVESGTKKPIFLELHDSPLSNQGRWNRVKDKISGFIVITKGLKDLLISQGIPEEKICLSMDAFDPGEFVGLPDKAEARRRLKLDDGKIVFVYTGHLFPWKGIDSIASGFDKIPEGSEFVIVGGNLEDLERVKKLVPSGAKNVRFTGRMPHAEALLWLAAADAAVLPTSAKFEIGRLYTSPIKLFEYLAAGLPVIASDVPSAHEVLDESMGIFFSPDDAGSFADALGKFVGYPDEVKKGISEACRKCSGSFTWEKRGEMISAFIKSNIR